MKEKEYRNRYNGLHVMLQSAYLDYHYLKVLSHYVNDNLQQVSGYAMRSIKHICELYKMDLCLTLWKTCFDLNKKANTLHQLNSYLRVNHNLGTHYRFSKDVRAMESRVGILRTQVFAHNDAEHESASVRLEEFFMILEEARQYLNELCHPEIDDEVNLFTDGQVLFIQEESIFGLGRILEHGIFKSED